MSDPRNTIETVVQTAIDSALKELHTCLPGVVQAFDPIEQLADIQPTIQRKLKGELVNLPLLVGVPVRFPKVSGFCVTMPLKEGDEVEVKFVERSIDNWLLDGGIRSANDVRMHSLSDAYATPMMYSQQNKITDFDPDNMQIRNDAGTSFITLTASGDIILNGDTDFIVAFNDMKAAFDTLVSDFNSHMHPTAALGSPSPPVVPTSADMSGAKVDIVKVP